MSGSQHSNGHGDAVLQAVRFQQGDESALAFFFREFHPALSLYACRWVENRSIAEEIAADAFIKTWKLCWKLDSYAAIRAYLYKTVRRDCIHSIKKEKRRAAFHKANPALTVSEESPYNDTVRGEVHRLVYSALRDLSPSNRKILVMHFLEGKNHWPDRQRAQSSS